MRDGVVLRGDLYFPEAEGRYPVLICRTPYEKGSSYYPVTARYLAEAGYGVLVQNQRGRYDSEGDFHWMFADREEGSEATDGYDTVMWASRLPFCDGRVGTWGNSNAAYLAWLMIAAQPKPLAASLTSGMMANLLDLTFGIFETGRRLDWVYMMAADERRRRGGMDGPVTPDEALRQWSQVERGKYIWWLPLGEIPDKVFPGLADKLQRYHREQHLELMRFGELHPRVDVPMFLMTGWWDRLVGTVDNFSGIRRQSAPEVRNKHRLLIGPWGHDPSQLYADLGPVDYGPEASTTYGEIVRRWYDFQFKGVDNGMAEEDPVRLFIVGENRWCGYADWPPPGLREQTFFLRSEGHANTVQGDGLLSPEAPGEGEPCDSFIYDPRDPLMSLMREDSQVIPMDQSPHDHREDLLVYQTPPLASDLKVVGHVWLHLCAATDAPDTDWSAKLAVVDEWGLAINLTYGIIRARYREGYDAPKLLRPGEVFTYRIRLNPVGCRFLAGQRLRLYISSSDFPNFDRNHNTGCDYWSDPELRPARQRVFHDAARVSRLVLPVE